jgi:F0F1-type ATP synthase assembly protein I
MAKLLISKKAKRLKASKKSQTKKSSKSKKKTPKLKRVSKWRAVPLNGSFMVTAILGFLISYYYVFDVSYKFGVVCMLFFAIMFIASLVSMTKAPLTQK